MRLFEANAITSKREHLRARNLQNSTTEVCRQLDIWDKMLDEEIVEAWAIVRYGCDAFAEDGECWNAKKAWTLSIKDRSDIR